MKQPEFDELCESIRQAGKIKRSPFVPPPRFIIDETEHWWINHRCDMPYPGYLMIGAKDPNGTSLSDLSDEALSELGPLLARCGRALIERLGAVRVYDGRYGHTPGQTVHFHVIPVYDWTIAAYWEDDRYRSLQQFYAKAEQLAALDFDGADMTLFIWRTFAEPGATLPETSRQSVDDAITVLRDELSR